MRRRWALGLSATLGLWVGGVGTVGAQWRPATSAPVIAATPASAASVSSTNVCTAPAATLGRPLAVLGRPVPNPPATGEPLSPNNSTAAITTASYETPAATFGPIIRGQAPDSGPPPVPPPGIPAVPGAADPFTHAPVPVGPAPPPPGGGTFWGRTGEWFGFGSGSNVTRHPFQSDHAFDMFASPVTNPFEFEDPRALTELRPIFLFQTSPTSNPFFHGANFTYYGVQGRVAITDRFSIVLQKFGWVHLEPGEGSTFSDTTGFSQVDIGPKVTFLRNDCTGTVGALGLTFEIPAGPHKVFQDTGNLTLRPYLSLAQTFGRSSYGSFDAMGTIGYNFATDNQRTDNFFTSVHLDYNVANLNKIYPFLELNWRHYTSNGKANNFDFEGGDLFNFGSKDVSGHNNLTLAPGIRYKFTEWIQVGTALEFPIINRKDIEDFRWTLDLILRY
jgi:hypothetical protein